MKMEAKPTAMESFAESFKEKEETVKIYVGTRTETSVPYVVPKSILCKHSYFRKALSPPFVESQTSVIHFPEDSENAWSVLLYYFLRDDIEWSQKDKGDVFGMQNPHRVDNNLITFTDAYLLADRYGLSALQNKIVRAIILGSAMDRIYYKETLHEFFDLVPSDCPLRWVVLENLVMAVMTEYRDWDDLEGLMVYKNVFPDFMECYASYRDNPDLFPPFEHFVPGQEMMKKYFVQEPEEDEDS